MQQQQTHWKILEKNLIYIRKWRILAWFVGDNKWPQLARFYSFCFQIG